MNLPAFLESIADYARAEKYALSSIRKPSDLHLVWGPLYSRLGLGIGARLFSLYGFAEIPRSTWPDYLVNEPLKAKYAAITSKEARLIADDKIRFFEHCTEHQVPTVPILALIAWSRPENTPVRCICSPQELEQVLVPGEYFIKPSHGSHGEGAFALSVGPAGWEWAGHSGSHEDFFQYCNKALRHTKALLVQHKLYNHQTIRNLTQAKGLSTVRVVTFRQPGRIDILATTMRIVAGDSDVDSFCNGESGNLSGAIDVESGKLITARGSKTKGWPTITDVVHHPRSGKPMVGLQMPYWPEVLELVRKAHESIHGLHTVGWDVAITDEGPVIVEANWRYDIDGLQMTYKKGFKKIIDDHLAGMAGPDKAHDVRVYAKPERPGLSSA